MTLLSHWRLVGPIGLAIFAVALISPRLVEAGKYNEVLSIGDQAPDWKDLPDAVSGKKHSLDDLKFVPVIVVVFTCNSCPVATEYEDRILALAKKYGVGAGGTDDRFSSRGKVALVAINVNKVKEDLPPEMKKRAEKKSFPFPYLFDETQEIARKFGANFTPEFFVLSRAASDAKSAPLEVVYMGAMDDNSDPAKVAKHYVEQAVEAALKGGTPGTTETAAAAGCRIRFARERRK
jgi:peroxiredoxin